MSSLRDRLVWVIPQGAEAGALGIVLGLTIVVAILLTGGQILQWRSLEAMAYQLPLLGLFSLAQMVPMLTGGIDLSVVSSANLCGIVAAYILKAGWGATGVWLAIGSGLFAALNVGILNGVLIARVGITPIIATLATMILIRGISLAVTRGTVLAGFPPEFLVLGSGSVIGIPVSTILVVCVSVGLRSLLTRTPFGVCVYLYGSNPIATHFSGVNTQRLLKRVYLCSSLLAGLAGLVMISRFNAAQADYGSSYLLLTVLVNVLGGVDPMGGAGSLGGVWAALITLQLIATAFNLVGLSAHLANAIWGGLLIGVLLLRAWLRGYPMTHLKP